MVEEEEKQIGKYIVTNIKLGAGNFGTVYKGYKQSKPEVPLAVKVLDMENYQDDEEENQEMLKREIKILKQVASPYLVDMKDIFRTKNNIYMFLRYADGGDLRNKLKQSPNKKLTEAIGMKYFAQLVEGYKALHANDIIHRDIKPENVLLDKVQNIALLTDFGLGKVTQKQADKQQDMTVQGTPFYRSPQLLTEEETHVKFSNKCDVWSMGTLLFEILNGKRPWTATTIPDYLQAILKKPITFLEPNISGETQDLIKGMLKINEEERLSWEQVFQHPAILKQNIPEEP